MANADAKTRQDQKLSVNSVANSPQESPGGLVAKIIQTEHELLSMGIPEEEVHRVLISMFENPTPDAEPFPGPITGIDLAGSQPKYLVPDTGFPPVFTPNPESSTDFIPSVGPAGYLSLPTPDPLGSVQTNEPSYDANGSNISHTYNIVNPPTIPTENWIGTASDVNSEPSMHGLTGFNSHKAIPEWRYDVEQSQSQPYGMPPIAIYPSGTTQEAKKKLMRFVYEKKENCPICKRYDGQIYDVNSSSSPIPPSLGKGYTNTHPNCQCTYETVDVSAKAMPLTQAGKKHISHVNRVIGQKSRHGELHPVRKDGTLSDKVTSRNIRKAQESIGVVNATWLEPGYLENAKKAAEAQGGRLDLIKAAEETITDHRSEGEPYLRKLAATELQKMTRTAIGHGIDLNHMGPDFRTSSVIIDGEWDPNVEEMQYLVIESDPEVIAAIDRGDIADVSINGGAPRREVIEPCDGHCTDGSCQMCNVPVGVILAELDDIGFTWVVTRPFMWKGNMIPAATPGIKTTVIQPI